MTALATPGAGGTGVTTGRDGRTTVALEARR